MMNLILNRVAWMYYYGEMKQQEIADSLHISRVTVNRLLKQAQKEGIVEITINPQYLKMYEYEDELKQKTNLEHVVVVPDTHEINDSLCRGAAHLLNDRLDSNGKLGIGLSKTLKMLHKYVKPNKLNFEAIVSICGTAYPDLSMTPLDIGFTLANELKIAYYTIWAPVLVSEEKSSKLIKQDIYISKVLKMATTVNYAIVGIGDVTSSRLTDIEYIVDSELDDLRNRGAVGEIIGHYYDINGNIVDSGVTDRLICVDFPMECPVIGVAGGKDKIFPIIGAIKTNMLQGLVVNESTCEAMLQTGYL